LFWLLQHFFSKVCVLINNINKAVFALNVFPHSNKYFRYVSAFCLSRGTLDQLCGEIAGDATLFSMYRSDANPVACPFKGPFSFTYNRGSGECARPVSRVDSCIAESRLRLRYQACADVVGSESSCEYPYNTNCATVGNSHNFRYIHFLKQLNFSWIEVFFFFQIYKVAGSIFNWFLN
jgi:hypothetical protein